MQCSENRHTEKKKPRGLSKTASRSPLLSKMNMVAWLRFAKSYLEKCNLNRCTMLHQEKTQTHHICANTSCHSSMEVEGDDLGMFYSHMSSALCNYRQLLKLGHATDPKHSNTSKI